MKTVLIVDSLNVFIRAYVSTMANKKFDIKMEELKLLYCVDEMSMSDIAEKYGCSTQTICNLMRKFKIPARKTQTKKAKAKLSASKAGENHPFYGKKRPEHGAKLKGRKREDFSDETKTKMSKAKNGLWGGRYSGPDHPNWVPPEERKSPLYKQIRDCVQMKEWRKTIFNRDDYTCQTCLKRGGILNADHIKQFAVILKENGILTLEQAKNCVELWEITNGRTLCNHCHRQTETFAKRVNA